MAGFNFGGGGSMPTANSRFAQLLAQSDPNNGTIAGGVGSMAQKLLMGLMLGQDQRDETSANEAFTKGMSAKPWVNPDAALPYLPPDPKSENPLDVRPNPVFGQPKMIENQQGAPVPMNQTGGGLAGGLAAMQGMQGNPYAGRLAQQLMMKKAESDQAMQQKITEMGLAQRNAMDLKAAPGWEKAPPVKTVTTDEGVFVLNHDGTLGNRLGAPHNTNSSQETFGNTPIWGTDKDGNPVLMQPSNRGGVKVVSPPAGVTPQRGQTTKVDLGDHFAILDANGTMIGTMPKSLAPDKALPYVRDAAQAGAEGRGAGDAEAAQNKKVLGANNVVGLIDSALPLIEKSSAGLVDQGWDLANQAFGRETEGAKALGSLRVIQSQIMQQIPRMEGPQSDKDVDLYREAAADIANPNKSRGVRIAAASTLRMLQQKYADSHGAPAAAPSAPQQPGVPPPPPGFVVH